MKTIDARGLSCPEPVILTRNAMTSKEKSYEILVDNVTAKENVSRFASHQGYRVTVTEKDEDYLLRLEK
ncbi:MAG: sulfurtransferase TusA family protein [Blautia sp.]|nr:sulfurtransferase TusA family protein [Blautia sp.]MDY5030723.1 sulfurtransferase TusA family protein [Blautia sp.]